MTPRNIFRIIVATAGLVAVCYGAMFLIDGLLYTLGLFQLQHSSPKYYGARGAIQLLLGLMLLRGIPPRAAFAFPPEKPSDRENTPGEK